MNFCEEGQRLSLAGEKRGTVYHAGLSMNHGDSLGARKGDTAVNGLMEHMAADRKPTTSKSPSIRSEAKGTARVQKQGLSKGRMLQSQNRVHKRGTGTRKSRKVVYEG